MRNGRPQGRAALELSARSENLGGRDKEKGEIGARTLALKTPLTPALSVLALCRYSRLGSSTRLRFLDLLPLLRQEGLRVDVCSFFDDFYLTRLYVNRRPTVPSLLGYYGRRLRAMLRTRRYDLVWLEKEALPWLPWWLEGVLLRRRPYAVDFDDAWYLRYQDHSNPLVRASLAGKLRALVRRSRLAIVGNARLETWAEEAGASRILQLPTAVNLDRYPLAIRAPNEAFTIGWIGSPGTARAYLPPLAPVFAELATAVGCRLELVGSGPLALPGVTTTILPWSEAEEAHLIGRFDVGIMPLAHDLWSESKCAYKLIQYMAAGLPVVASPVGMNRTVVRDGVNGFFADTAEEWRSALLTLRHDAALRRRMGAAGRRLVEAEFSHVNAGLTLAQGLRQAALS
jgi:glycosyltransferase involved in cell wall biosynthesis